MYNVEKKSACNSYKQLLHISIVAEIPFGIEAEQQYDPNACLYLKWLYSFI